MADDAKAEIEKYLDVYTQGPLTKATMLERMAEGRDVDPGFLSKFRIKRMGKDKNDTFWLEGKIHGWENLAYVDDDELAACTNPSEIQRLVDRANDEPKPLPPATWDKAIEELHHNLAKYKAGVDN